MANAYIRSIGELAFVSEMCRVWRNKPRWRSEVKVMIAKKIKNKNSKSSEGNKRKPRAVVVVST